ncbi:carbon dioxide concentrating mechanism/carboxysome shell protein [Desulfosporosinus acidiphilus SJ4]|uniref:Carbon dioxide concentrating mechanism/carboxysome shell protein n=1 Tax=Desulfosporosinus acidiphilus (strain DSM 22704 / JCM 16185 / SJ4) TaxID=646529 RepID=I4D459_DESAJ|nr:BMC domain-containing protein [Desulfosporosinus acidiphilus]AFM40583.1 carbon dioxide concentrating mechanism/carboxysome shell protein [Desulfosporosinus acidiphilus SJ4]
MYRAIGMIEVTSIARGIYASDQMLKTAYVDVVSATSVCPGKFVTIIHGDVAAVESSVSAGVAIAGEYLVDSFILPNVHPGVFPAITATSMPEGTGALGIMESFSMASMVTAADAALKAADIQALELRLGRGLGGKAYFTFTGDVAAVEAGIEAGKAIALEKGLLVDTEVIPSPSKRLWSSLF